MSREVTLGEGDSEFGCSKINLKVMWSLKMKDIRGFYNTVKEIYFIKRRKTLFGKLKERRGNLGEEFAMQ